jgi:8-oxo-dGTP pyrophosphatase MutT (NUDIX family)
MIDASRSPAAPRAASTIMLLRDGLTGLEVFMVVRHHEIDFASGALVFPGGRMEAADAELAADICGRDRRLRPQPARRRSSQLSRSGSR